MAELNPVLQAYDASASAISANNVLGSNRLTVLSRNTGGTRGIINKTGASVVGETMHANFMNGSNWDLTVDGSTTSQSFVVAAGTKTVSVVSVSILFVYSRPPVFNGNCFGGTYLGGLLGSTVITPGPLSDGLVLSCSAAGVTSTLATMTVNEDLAFGPTGPQAGPLGGPYLIRASWAINQVLTGGSSDKLTCLVQDNLASNRSIIETRAVVTAVVGT